ncbi:hypothetical protein KSC_017990 [Ktedonobacter sp. SOSP1-52]|nr:hypothetical protein KSC_017990 [Ktedonobacter sp. SOSP1-52]
MGCGLSDIDGVLLAFPDRFFFPLLPSLFQYAHLLQGSPVVSSEAIENLIGSGALTAHDVSKVCKTLKIVADFSLFTT